MLIGNGYIVFCEGYFIDDLERLRIELGWRVVGSIVLVQCSSGTIGSVLDISLILKRRLRTCP